MQRAQAILVIIALLATPLALLARSPAGDTPVCERQCCLSHTGHSHTSHMQHSGARSDQSAMMCHRGDAGHMVDCSMKAGHHALDYGFLAPMAPTAPLLIASVAAPNISREFSLPRPETPLSGHLSAPFKPPRS